MSIWQTIKDMFFGDNKLKQQFNELLEKEKQIEETVKEIIKEEVVKIEEAAKEEIQEVVAKVKKKVATKKKK